MKIYKNVVIQPLPEHKYMLFKSFTYRDVVVPVGFVTNGADVPRVLWWLYPPNRSDYLPAVLVHDFLCSIDEFEKADRYFKDILIALGISDFDIFMLHTGVRIYTKLIRGKIGVKDEY